jgi:guanosine-3',5'-bis(diphosphate) 3'-pyrophosphohydrolase
VAGDVMTTATAGAGGAARIEEPADRARVNEQNRGETDQETATRPQPGAPGNVRSSPPDSVTRTPRGASDGQTSAPDTRPEPPAGSSPDPERAQRPARPVRQGLAPAAQPAPPGAGVRRRLARLGAQRGSGVNPVLEPLIKTIRAHHPKADVRTVERAYGVAAHWHRDQKRKSGDPYITHPLAVATILAELGMNTETICAALLHDTVEDTPYTLSELRSEFGEDVAALVDGVTKLDKVKYGASAEAETVRKMVVAMSRDIRVLVIKLADRLHNMRTLRYMPRDKQERKSRETLEIYAPLAHRLGMNTVKWELEDLAFATLYPKRYDEIARLVSQRSPRRDQLLQEVIENLSADLHEARIKGTVTGRPKHYYSIYQKMIARNVEFDDIYDLVGIRVLVDTVRDCYAALGTIHARWNPVPGRFKDYIAMPKFNLYQSLHTTVIGPGGKPVELQIRTWDMHKRAEYGVAAHWKYKEDMRSRGPALASGNPAVRAGSKAEARASQDAAEMAWLRQLVDWQRETEDPAEFLDSLRFDLAGAEVYVFTPRGEVIALPQGATPVDFAYAIHTDVGHRTIGARVNGRLVALESTLDNGDTVEIFTSKAQEAGPNRDWLNFVKSARARNKIRQWFSKERREAAVEAGKDQIAKVMRKQGLPLQRLMSAETLKGVAADLRYPDLSGLYAAVGEGRISAQSVVARLVNAVSGGPGSQEDLAEVTPIPPRAPKVSRSRATPDSGIEVEGAGDVWVRLSKCCTPVPGDEIAGFVTHGHGVSVHRANCVNLEHLSDTQRERMVPVHWAPSDASVFLVAIQVEALDRTRLLSDVTRVLSDQHVNILSASVQTTRDRVALSRFTFEMGDPKHLGDVLRAVRNIDGVYDVYRVTN